MNIKRIALHSIAMVGLFTMTGALRAAYVTVFNETDRTFAALTGMEVLGKKEEEPVGTAIIKPHSKSMRHLGVSRNTRDYLEIAAVSKSDLEAFDPFFGRLKHGEIILTYEPESDDSHSSIIITEKDGEVITEVRKGTEVGSK